MTRLRLFILALAGGTAAGLAWAADPPKPAAQAAAPPVKLSYAGEETCAGCHDEINKAFAKNPHFTLEKNEHWTGKACEACHGMGSKHAESLSADDITNPSKLAPAKIDALCLNCHKNQTTHAGRLQSGHARNEIPCTSCHNMHKTGPESTFVTLKHTAGINALCSSCHIGEAASFKRPYHHKVPEGTMACTACHNPHSSFIARNQQAASTGSEPSCVNCHGDKRGPFVHPHSPVQTEGCTACHEPHGSVNPRMLIRQEVSLLCLECHSNIQSPSPGGSLGGLPPAFHDFRLARYRSCTMCHQKIHGSNADRGLLR